mgnify:CR=1 FL=1
MKMLEQTNCTIWYEKEEAEAMKSVVDSLKKILDLLRTEYSSTACLLDLNGRHVCIGRNEILDALDTLTFFLPFDSSNKRHYDIIISNRCKKGEEKNE